MRNFTTVLSVAALAGCATFAGTVEDGGRAYRETTEAPVAANLEPLAAEPSIQILNDRIPTRGGGGGAGRTGGAPASACDAERWQSLLGFTRAQVTKEDLQQPFRLIEYGEYVTQDYLPARLDVYFDQQGKVYRVICG